MSVTNEQFSEIARFRRVLLSDPDGRAVLGSLLRSGGLFSTPLELRTIIAADGPEVVLENIIGCISLLHQLGVWHDTNWLNILDRMVDLPMPDIEERNDDGKT